MPITPTFPGVYIEEIPSGVRTITGVATAITAFLGRALRGPVNKAVTINSYADFERTFGGLWLGSSLGYAVRDFYLNGGGQAVIVRLYRPEGGDTPRPSTAKLTIGEMALEAAYEGAWGNALRVQVNDNVSAEAAQRLGLTENDLFNLIVRDAGTGLVEEFRNLSVKPSARRVDKVLENESRLVRVFGTLPDSRPAITTTDAVVVAEGQASDGQPLASNSFIDTGLAAKKEGLFALEQINLFNLLCIPPYTVLADVEAVVITEAAAYCEERRAMLIVDPPSSWIDKDSAKSNLDNAGVGTNSKNAAVFFPRLRQPNPLRGNQLEDFAPCGAVAGIFTRTDAQRGVWKAPAGLEATLAGVPQLSVSVTDAENGELNQLGINCLRTLPPAGRVVWGARTLQGDDRLGSEWKYIPVRRLALFIEESLYRGTQWVVFEPNDEALWSQIRLNFEAFLQNLFLQGAFQGKTPREAYFVKCDDETTTRDDINRGIVNVVVGFAPLKPAEFVIIKIQQIAGQIQAA